jgi:hypothetical protein
MPHAIRRHKLMALGAADDMRAGRIVWRRSAVDHRAASFASNKAPAPRKFPAAG